MSLLHSVIFPQALKIYKKWYFLQFISILETTVDLILTLYLLLLKFKWNIAPAKIVILNFIFVVNLQNTYIIYLMINPLPFSGFRVVDDVTEELDGQHVLRASLLPRVAVTKPIVGFLNLFIIKNIRLIPCQQFDI